MYGINNAQDLVDKLQKIADTHGIELKDLEVNIRQDYDSDAIPLNWICEDLYDEKTNSVLVSVSLMNDADDEDCNFSD